MKSAVAITALVAGASALPHAARQASYGNDSAVWQDLRGKIKHVVSV